MTQPLTLKDEKMAGARADYVVFYERDGKRYLDGIWADSLDEARESFLRFAAELGWRVQVERIEKRDELREERM